MDALQNANFSGDPVHGDAEAVNIEARRARRAVGLAHHAHLMPRVGHGFEQVGQRNSSRAAFHRVIRQAALLERSRCEVACDLEQIVAQIFSGKAHRFTGNARANAGKSARVVRCAIRIRVDDIDA